MSKTTQNALLHCIWEIIQHKIVKDVQQQCDYTKSFYGIQADEVTDVSNWEQLGIILRYVSDGEPVERLIEFIVKVFHVKVCENIFKP